MGLVRRAVSSRPPEQPQVRRGRELFCPEDHPEPADPTATDETFRGSVSY